ncbi:glycosyltransferase family 2 protein [uncultured Metabacillus sp.]|uniref:glycosyltransferase family 2 protein n=1 Tax=uncultured Metabacillus sp. TaxID=2860135 RepID=UPI00261880E8|nr:glycosyltransferase family 2 protein [uncultured Metabacillus sp.]
MRGLSLIIITYNRKNELIHTLETLKKQDYSGVLEIIIIDQNSIDGTEEAVSHLNDDNVVYIKLEKNLGVAGGRNVGVRYASFENMIFLDDDAHFVSLSALSEIENIMDKNPHKIFAFQIKDLEGGLFHWPYGKKLLKKRKETFECNKYIGCGHAIKKSFFKSVNGYSNDMFFGFEETELVMKMFGNNELPVLYTGSVEIVHRVTPITRIVDNKRFYYKVRNRLFVIREMHPVGGGTYLLYYLLAYLYRAITLKTFSEYKSGVRDAFKTSIDKRYRMSYKNFFRYLLLNK